ncbi:MAG: type II secretion system secretin GspD [Bdellovibrionales bacterium]|nr:type II secretion system secretin GspD [Bdellovibrionales bacterium]
MKFSKVKAVTVNQSEIGHWQILAHLVGISALLCTWLYCYPAYGQEDEIAKDASTEINVKNADLAAIIRIFSKKTKRNYILDERVKGKVSIYLPGRVSAEDAIRILDSVLDLKGFTAVPIGDNLWKIIAAREAKQTTIPTVEESDGRGSPTIVTRVINLKYIGADEVKQLFSPLISGNGLMNAYTGTNSLIIIDSEDNINRIMKLIEAVDIPFTDQEMSIIPVSHAEATDIAEKINEILGKDGEDSSSQNAAAANNSRARLNANPGKPTNVNGGGVDSPSLTVSARSREPKIIADERTNSLILVADEETTARIRALVSQLDSPVDRSGNRFYVYRCQHANAEELAEVLSGLADGDGGSSRSSSGGSTASASNTDRNTNSRDRGDRFQSTLDRVRSQSRTPGRSRSENGSEQGGVSSASIGENISITADPATNSLVINASKTDYEKLKELLKQLDVPRRQVLVEAMILEVGVSDNSRFGTEWIASGGGDDGGIMAINNAGGLTNLLQDPRGISDFSIAAASAGSLTLPGGITIPTQSILLQAANTNSNVNVLSSPNILATDNQQAEIVVGQNVPFLASRASNEDNLNNTFNQIDRQDVGITLRITPQISSSDFVTLEIFTEVSNVVDSTASSDLGPTTTVRTSETTVVTKNNQMIVIGGLMSDDISETNQGVPFLKDVPVLGHFFRRNAEAQRRTNLLIFITPRIIKDQYDARDQTINQRGELEYAMDRYDVWPKRAEILRSDDVDSVIEPMEFEGELPTTMQGPERNRQRASVAHGIEVNGNEISVSVAPKLPSVRSYDSTEMIAKLPDSKPASEIQVSRLSNSGFESPKGAGGTFVVLQVENKDAGSVHTPFAISKGSKLVGVTVPEGSSLSSKSFFAQGQRYVYQSGSHALKLKALGTFSSAAQAKSQYGDLSQQWYTLSPHEVMNLGRSPWKQG